MLKRPVTVISIVRACIDFYRVETKAFNTYDIPFPLRHAKNTCLLNCLFKMLHNFFRPHSSTVLWQQQKLLLTFLEIVNRVLKQQTKRGVLLCTSGFISVPSFFVQTTCSPFCLTFSHARIYKCHKTSPTSRIFTKKNWVQTCQ